MRGRDSVAGRAIAALAALSGCVFDTTSATSGELFDASASPPDAADCEGAPVVTLSVDGASEPAEPGGPLARVLVGDTVELSAVVECAEDPRYRWVVEPSTTLIGDTAAPGLDAPSLTVYPPRPEAYTARLTVTSSGGETTIARYAFDAVGWRRLDHLPADAAISDLAADEDHLWIASDRGAYRAELTDPTSGPYPRLGELYVSVAGEPPEQLSAIYSTGSFVWIATDLRSDVAWLADLGAGLVAEATFPATVRVRDLGPAPAGVRAATDTGVLTGTPAGEFELERSGDSYALASSQVGSASGGDKLLPLPVGSPIDVFGGNNRIRALAADATGFWVGGENQGVAHVVDGAVEATYTAGEGDLPDDRVNAIAVDSAGDVWVATPRGVARFKRDRGEWVILSFGAGLDGRIDLAAIAVDESAGRRAIYAGSSTGLVLLQLD